MALRNDDKVIEPTPSRVPNLALLQELRYRRQFLKSDGRLNAVAFGIVCAAYMISIANDFRMLHGGWLLAVALLGRLLTFAVTVVSIVLMLRAKRPRQQDLAFALWVVGVAVANVPITLTRIPSGEYQGVLFAANTILGFYYFAMRGPQWPRLVAAGLYISSIIVVIWSPTAAIGPVFRQSSVVVLFAWTAMGIISSRNSNQQRRKQFQAERDERRLRKELALRLRELAIEKERAEETSRVRTAFLAVMSHEFRTPMNAVIGLSDLLLERPLDPDDKDNVQIIGDSARSLLTILNDILDFTKIDTQKLSLSVVPFDLRRLAASVVDMLRPTAQAKAIDLSLEIDPALPPCLLGDDIRLRQVLVNLVANAIKFTEQGSVRVQVTVRTQAGSDPQIIVRVHDTGIGMTPETITRLFRPFVQADAGITRRYGGSGLGLTISQQILLVMGGEILVHSEPGRGSVFSFAVQLPEGAQPEPLPALPDAAPLRHRPLRVLVVDDYVVNREVARSKLVRAGHLVEAVSEGRQAILAAQQTDYDLIFMDLQMPGMGGMEATQQIIAALAGRRLPLIVALTASVIEEDREACRKVGMFDFLSKPLEQAALQSVLDRVTVERAAQLAPESLAKLKYVDEPGESQFVAELCQLFLSETHKRLPRMVEALRQGDAKTLAREAHTLRSGSATVGAMDMAALCKQLEQAASAGELSQVGAWLDQLTVQLTQIEQALGRTANPAKAS